MHFRYEYVNRRCITEEECFNATRQQKKSLYDKQFVPFVIFNGTCTDHCPAGYQLDDEARSCIPCRGKCNKTCQGGSIDNIAAAQKLRGCTLIAGSIEINIRSGKPKIIAQELEENLGDIQEITGFLKIVRSSPIVNLHFLKNLMTIRGEHEENYAMLVLENQNLQELWDWDTKPNFKILKNRLFFHYNPKLCLHHIMKLIDIVHQTNVTDVEVSKESNGYKFPCNAATIVLSVRYKSSNTIQIHIPTLEVHSEHSFLRYVIYYTKDPGKNISKFDDLDQCSDYGWMSKDISINTREHPSLLVNLTNLEPYTQYSFYVTAFTVDKIVATSEIQTDRTDASKPSELLSVNVIAKSSSEIFVSWKPPRQVNGKLEEFIITWSALERDDSLLNLRDYCKNPMTYITNLSPLKPEVTNRTATRNNTCCIKEKEIPKDGYDRLCSKSHYYMVPSAVSDIESRMSCEAYFNNYLRTTELIVKDDIRERRSDTSISSKLREVSEILYLNDKLNVNKIKLTPNTELKTNTVQLSAVERNFTIIGLKKFQDYIVTIEACREKDYALPSDVNDFNTCSKRDIVVVRTEQDKKADIISNGIAHEVVNRTLHVTWSSPSHPNGLIVAYELEYRQKDVIYSKSVSYCISYMEYKLNKHSYMIVDLLPGNYELRIRAISLAGRGPFTAFRSFTVPRPFTIPEYSIALALTVFTMFVVIIVMLTLQFFKNKKPNLDLLIANVNPDYASILDQWEVSKEDIVLVKEIGSGTFGKVFEGRLQPNNKPCAVKTVNENTFAYDRKLFLNEASIMKSVSGTYHIVQLLGVVSREKPPLVIMELMNGGDLRSFLISSRSEDPPNDIAKFKIAAQVADGMCFMEAKKFVHRDLAARNCLVNRVGEGGLVVKIGDFGMTRDVYETDYYRKGDKGLLPIRWMAPESLKDGLFTSHSDVWSYGVVLWEIVTLGEQPYQGSSNETVLREVMAGRLRLQIPSYCPDPLKNIMRACWRIRSAHRINFMRTVGSLECFVDEEFKKVSYYHSDEATNTRQTMPDYVEMFSVEDPLLSEEEEPYEMNGITMNGGITLLMSKHNSRFPLKFNSVEDLDSLEEV